MLLVDDLAAGGTKNLRHTPRGLVTLLLFLPKIRFYNAHFYPVLKFDCDPYHFCLYLARFVLKSRTHTCFVLAWGNFLIVPDSWSLNWTTYQEIGLPSNACVITMTGEHETAGHFGTEKKYFDHVSRNRSCTTLI